MPPKPTRMMEKLRVLELEAIANAPTPVPEPPKQRILVEQPKEKPRFEIGSGWLVRTCTFLARCIASPLATLAQMALLPIKAWKLTSVVLSKNVSVEDRIKRWEKCAACSLCVIVVQKAGKGFRQHEYCGGCGCPKWRLSRLRYKNRKAGWQCPRGLHEGTAYDMDAYIDWAERSGYPELAERWKLSRGVGMATETPNAKASGCGGRR